MSGRRLGLIVCMLKVILVYNILFVNRLWWSIVFFFNDLICNSNSDLVFNCFVIII